ncbi:MAG: sigma-54 dependent transcriptional regulator [Thermoanaerobaculia bacterium]|nr:sigma-54 dependent transcriptional regulator [Thermoanaerobaculia bacterium]
MLLRALVWIEPKALRDRVSRGIKKAGTHVTEGRLDESLWEQLEQGGFDLLVVTAADLPDPWRSTLPRVRSSPEQTEVVGIVDGDRPQDRVLLHAAGAFAVLHSDLEPEGWEASLRTVLRRFRELALSRFRATQEDRVSILEGATKSPAMQRLLDLATRVAAADTTLLILGETGVGKEWLARRVHDQSPRSAGPFVAVNCAAVPESLMESELFGHEAGAFTGAVRARRGAFELAHRGTLFLDEVGDMPIHLQAKLLRALQEREIQRLGAERPVPLDVRIIAATNQDLHGALDRGEFRRDLFYRLSVVMLQIPPLRERREDVRPLVSAYLDHFKNRLGRPRLDGFSEESLHALEQHLWPGNVRELINAVERGVLLAEGDRIEATDLLHQIPAQRELAAGHTVLPSPGLTNTPLAEARQRVVEAFERDYLHRLLQSYRGRVDEVAEVAGVNPRTLYNKMRSYGLRKEHYRISKRSPSTTSR